jgi:hypothetical protein
MTISLVKSRTEPKMKRIITILIGVLAAFMGVGLILPALAKARDYGAMPNEVIGFYTLGIVLAVAGFIAAVFALSKRKAA